MKITDSSDCVGCTTCEKCCPRNAISMQKNEEGFLYPVIDEKKCIQCNICQKVCPINSVNNCDNIQKVFAVKHNSPDIRKQSTSGGAFTALAENILKKNGWVFGAMYDDNMNVVHGGTDSIDKVELFRGSKYTQTVLGNTFTLVEEKLNLGKNVLFTGTPCQCAGLKCYLDFKKTNQNNLVICDIVCHGVPSPLLWSDHMNSLEKKYGKIEHYYCRSKIKGWHNHIEHCVWKSGIVEYGTRFVQKQKNIFYTNLCLRESCGNCKFASLSRCSDITIADYWGIEKCHPEFDDDNGVSFFMINSVKGEKVFNEISESIVYINGCIEECFERQPNLQHPTPVDEEKRKIFWRDYHKHGYMYVCRKYTEYGYINAVRKQVARVKRKVCSLTRKQRCI